jgi:hypothetical protein
MTKPKEPSERKIHKRDLRYGVRVGLEEEDREPAVKKLTNLLRKSEKVRLLAKDTQASFRKELKELKEAVEEQTLLLEEGKEVQMDCLETKNFQTGKLTIRRKDTDKVVFTRDLTDEDRQLEVGESGEDDDDDDEDDEKGAAA